MRSLIVHVVRCNPSPIIVASVETIAVADRTTMRNFGCFERLFLMVHGERTADADS